MSFFLQTGFFFLKNALHKKNELNKLLWSCFKADYSQLNEHSDVPLTYLFLCFRKVLLLPLILIPGMW